MRVKRSAAASPTRASSARAVGSCRSARGAPPCRRARGRAAVTLTGMIVRIGEPVPPLPRPSRGRCLTGSQRPRTRVAARPAWEEPQAWIELARAPGANDPGTILGPYATGRHSSGRLCCARRGIRRERRRKHRRRRSAVWRPAAAAPPRCAWPCARRAACGRRGARVHARRDGARGRVRNRSAIAARAAQPLRLSDMDGGTPRVRLRTPHGPVRDHRGGLQRVSDRDAARLPGRRAGGRLAVATGDRARHRSAARAAFAGSTAAAQRPLQLPRLCAARGAAPPQPLRACDARGEPRPGLPLRQLAQLPESLWPAVHGLQLSGGAAPAARRLLGDEADGCPAEPRVPMASVPLCTAARARPPLRARVRGAQPALSDLRGGRLPQRLLHVGALARRRAPALAQARSQRRGGGGGGRIRQVHGRPDPAVLVGGRRRRAARILIGAAAAAVLLAAGSFALFGAHLPNVSGQSSLATPYSVANLAGVLVGVGGATPAVTHVADLLVLGLALTLLRRRAAWIAGIAYTTLALIAALAWVMPWYIVWALPFAALADGTGSRRLTLAFTIFLLLTFLPVSGPFLAAHGLDPFTSAFGRHVQALAHHLSG